MMKWMKKLDENCEHNLIPNLFAVCFILTVIASFAIAKYNEWDKIRKTEEINFIFGAKNERGSSDRL